MTAMPTHRIGDHCALEREATTEERDRYLRLLRQQGIRTPLHERLGKIAWRGPRRECPHYLALSEDLAYCTSECHLKRAALALTEAGVQ